jgi:hypothetical protein
MEVRLDRVEFAPGTTQRVYLKLQNPSGVKLTEVRLYLTQIDSTKDSLSSPVRRKQTEVLRCVYTGNPEVGIYISLSCSCV